MSLHNCSLLAAWFTTTYRPVPCHLVTLKLAKWDSACLQNTLSILLFLSFPLCTQPLAAPVVTMATGLLSSMLLPTLPLLLMSMQTQHYQYLCLCYWPCASDNLAHSHTSLSYPERVFLPHKLTPASTCNTRKSGNRLVTARFMSSCDEPCAVLSPTWYIRRLCQTLCFYYCFCTFHCLLT